MAKSPLIERKLLRTVGERRASESTFSMQQTRLQMQGLTPRYSGDNEQSPHVQALHFHPDTFKKQYTLGEMIGQGATSSVFFCRENATQKEHAVKIIPNSKVLSTVFPTIAKEISILKRLDHPYVIHMHDTLITTDSLYIIMELVEGPELFDVLVQKKCFPEFEARDLIHKILDAVAYLHSQNIAHRDLKPENIKFVSSSSEIKILDFGFARLLSITGDDGCFGQPPAGTLGYEAPEILCGEHTSFAVDVWAVGVMAYILLCGFPPFFSEAGFSQDAELLESYPYWVLFNDDSPYLRNSIIKGDYSFFGPVWEGVSDEAKSFISALLKVKPRDRLTAQQALEHEWFKLSLKKPTSPDRGLSEVENGSMVLDLSSISIQEIIKTAREVLLGFFEKRPTKEELEKAHILVSHSGGRFFSSKLRATQHELWLAELKDYLENHLKTRPSIDSPAMQHLLFS